MTPTKVVDLANMRRERAEHDETLATGMLDRAIAKWKTVGIEGIKFSNVHCRSAPADLGCVYVRSSNPSRNPCVFCGSPEDDVL